MNTYSAKPSEIKRKWFAIDASDLVLGRVSTIVAKILMGKDKVMYTPHLDCGDYMVIYNAEKITLTGKKLEQKHHYWHTGYPGGIKSRTAKDTLRGENPERLLRNSIERMMTRNSLGRQRMKKLFIYNGDTHPHQAQQPEILDIKSLNKKNSK